MLRRLLWVSIFVVVIGLSQHPVTTAQIENDELIRVWWPETLYTDAARPVIDGLFASFNSTSSTQISPRIYLTTYSGQSINSQLTLVNTVAPDARPDVILLRREDMLTLIQQTSTLPTNTDPNVYVQQPVVMRPLAVWDTLVITNEFATLSPTLPSMGEVNGVLYGLPYLIEIQHVLYQPTAYNETPTTTQNLLSAEEPLLFAARPSVGQAVNDFVLTLYVNAGGTFVNSEGAPALSEIALRQTLNFVEEASAAQLIGNELLAYRSPQDYLEVLIEEESSFALVDSSVYLHHPDLASMSVSGIPAINDEQVVLIDGWVWVLLTDDAIRQSEAYQFVRWMYETDQMVDIALVNQTLPVQERALNAMNDPYYEAVQVLLLDAAFVRGRRNQAAVALQSAFEAVLNGASADEAATTALNSLAPVDTTS